MTSSLRPVRGTAAELLALLREWEAARDEPPPLVIETSGSTGAPKRVVLSRRAMRASVRATHERLGGPGQWVLNLPPTYVAGVQVLFRSVLAGTEPVVTSDLTDAVGRLAGPRSYVSLVPTQLERCLDEGNHTSALTAFDAVLVGGGPLSTTTRRAAESAGIRVVQSYGMSETCGGCVYDGVPLDGVALKIDADDRVQISGPVLFDGYQDDPAGTAAVLRDGWFRTDDLGGFDDDGRLRITGRADDVVISGGVKVPAQAVQRMLAEHPSVDEVAVVGIPDAEWGERVVAVVAGGQVTLDELRDLVTPRAWAPRRMRPVPALPRLANGKLDRLTVRRWAADA